MSTKKQYFRKINPGDVSIEGRQSNGFTADKKGNVVFYSGLKDSELDYLAEIQNKDDIPLYYGNSYFGVIKSETHNTLNLGNDNYETLNEKVDANKIINAITPTPTPTPLPTITPSPVTSSLPPKKEETLPKAAPPPDDEEATEFIFLEEQSLELTPTQLTDYIVPAVVVPRIDPPEDLVTPARENEYTGPKNPTEKKGNNEVLKQDILKGRNGDVNQEIHLPHPSKKGKEIADGYRGLIPVKQVTFDANLISYADLIATFKRIGLTEKQARSCFALTGAEAARKGKSGYFSGYNWNIFGLQGEGKWRDAVSQYISYRYIARDSLDNINTGETTSLRIFAGFVNIDAAVSSKVEAMKFKGLLDAISPEDWAKKYRCTWVAAGCDDAAILANAKAIYNTWGVKFFDQHKGKIY